MELAPVGQQGLGVSSDAPWPLRRGHRVTGGPEQHCSECLPSSLGQMVDRGWHGRSRDLGGMGAGRHAGSHPSPPLPPGTTWCACPYLPRHLSHTHTHARSLTVHLLPPARAPAGECGRVPRNRRHEAAAHPAGGQSGGRVSHVHRAAAAREGGLHHPARSTGGSGTDDRGGGRAWAGSHCDGRCWAGGASRGPWQGHSCIIIGDCAAGGGRSRRKWRGCAWGGTRGAAGGGRTFRSCVSAAGRSGERCCRSSSGSGSASAGCYSGCAARRRAERCSRFKGHRCRG